MTIICCNDINIYFSTDLCYSGMMLSSSSSSSSSLQDDMEYEFALSGVTIKCEWDVIGSKQENMSDIGVASCTTLERREQKAIVSKWKRKWAMYENVTRYKKKWERDDVSTIFVYNYLYTKYKSDNMMLRTLFVYSYLYTKIAI